MEPKRMATLILHVPDEVLSEDREWTVTDIDSARVICEGLGVSIAGPPDSSDETPE